MFNSIDQGGPVEPDWRVPRLALRRVILFFWPMCALRQSFSNNLMKEEGGFRRAGQGANESDHGPIPEEPAQNKQ
jgi:hypothetical protein